MSTKQTKTRPQKGLSVNPNTWFIITLLALSAVFTYRAVQGEELNYDDERYITNNELIEELDAGQVGEIFTAYFDGHYHPLTLLSLAADRAIFQDHIKGHHLVNWLLHLANAVLVYLFLLALFKERWLAFGVALLFALHPMNVESYAWMTERKNVLYSFFFLAAGLVYIRHLKSPTWGNLGLVALLFILSLLSKTQAMMLVPVLFLLDWIKDRNFKNSKVYLEKLPFLLLAIGFVFLTSSAQVERWGDLDASGYSQLEKVFMASTAFFQYVFKGFFPFDLSAYYPYPKDNDMALSWYHYASPAFFLAFLGACVYAFKKSPKLFFGLAFFLINIFLMLKFLDVPYGKYMMADRYNYLPSVGLMLILVMGIRQLFKRLSISSQASSVAIVAVALVFGYGSYQRIKVWNNSADLWSDIIEDYPNYRHAYNMRALGYIASGQNEAAISDLREVIDLDPDFVDAYVNLGVLQYRLNRPKQALNIINKAKERFPEDARLYNLAATNHLKLKQPEKALTNIDQAIALEPDNPEYKLTRAQILLQNNRQKEAEQLLTQLPDHPRAQQLLAALRNQQQPQTNRNSQKDNLVQRATEIAKQGRFEEALTLFNQAIQADPQNAIAYLNRGATYGRMGQYQQALADFQKAAQINPNDSKAYYLLGTVYKDLGQKELACAHFQEAAQKGWQLSAELRAYCSS